MKNKSEKRDNPLIFREKPYYTDEEQKLYYMIAIDESLKQGNHDLAIHYKMLLDFLDNNGKRTDCLPEIIKTEEA